MRKRREPHLREKRGKRRLMACKAPQVRCGDDHSLIQFAGSSNGTIGAVKRRSEA
jgi:hypothetical protein